MTLHQKIEESLRINPHGWCSPTKAGILAGCVTSMGGGNVCEIGVYTGRSFLPMALAVKQCGKGLAIGIDAWSPEVAAEGEDPANADWWARAVPHDWVEKTFREKMQEMQVCDVCRIIRDDSANVEPPQEITVLHVDGQHCGKALLDTSRFAPNVVLGGFVCLDDLNWEGGNVDLSAQWLLNHGFVERLRVVGMEPHSIYKNDFCLMQRITP
jgi:hypothetical protein